MSLQQQVLDYLSTDAALLQVVQKCLATRETPNSQVVDESPALEYTPLDTKKPEIRLLTLLPGKFSARLECKLKNTSLGNNETTYEAVSYAWGAPIFANTIIVNGQSLKIADNLYHALQYLRSEDVPRVLWIDAICINQAALAEKNHQVKRMSRIYQGAKRVVSWLGKEVETTRKAFDSFEEMAAIGEIVLANLAVNNELRTKLERDPDTWNAIVDVVDRPYWQRGWIAQELANAREVLIMCGRHEISYSVIMKGLKCLFWVIGVASTEAKFQLEKFSWVSFFSSFSDWHSHEAKNASVLDRIDQFKYWKVTNPLDRIYAFLGLPCREDSTEFAVNYSYSENELWVAFARWHIYKTKTLDILSYGFSTTSVTTSQGVHNVPFCKWAPNWKNCYVRPLASYTTMWRNPIYHASQDTPFPRNLSTLDPSTRHSLPCTGLMLDRIKDLGDVLEPSWGRNAIVPQSSIMQQWEGMKNALSLQQTLYCDTQVDTSDIRLFTRPFLKNYQASDFASGSFRPDDPAKIHPGTFVEIEPFEIPFKNEPRHLALTEAYWRTLIGDQWPSIAGLSIFHREKAPEGRANRGVWRYWVDWRYGREESKVDEGKKQHPTEIDLFQSRAAAICINRRFMITDKGYMGLAPLSAQVGDEICIFRGGQTPYVIREYDGPPRDDAPQETLHHYVGDCYLHGMMDGEAMDGRLEDEQGDTLFHLV